MTSLCASKGQFAKKLQYVFERPLERSGLFVTRAHEYLAACFPHFVRAVMTTRTTPGHQNPECIRGNGRIHAKLLDCRLAPMRVRDCVACCMPINDTSGLHLDDCDLADLRRVLVLRSLKSTSPFETASTSSTSLSFCWQVLRSRGTVSFLGAPLRGRRTAPGAKTVQPARNRGHNRAAAPMLQYTCFIPRCAQALPSTSKCS